MEPLKKFGQHFLISREVAEFMVEAAGVTKDDTLLEIGPGRGMITNYLARRAGKLYFIEKDERLRGDLAFLLGNVHPIWGDAMYEAWPKDANKLVSNLPFNIASQVLFMIPEGMELAVLGVQKEVGEKMVAQPGESEYGRLSVAIQLLFKVEHLKNFPPSVFEPVPKVGLAVVRLKPLKRPENWPELEEFIRKIFCYPNKSVNNALKLAGYPEGLAETGGRKKVRNLTGTDVVRLVRQLHKST